MRNQKKLRYIIRETVKEVIENKQEVKSGLKNWKHKKASDYVERLLDNFGVPAVFSENGYAEWKNIAGFKRVAVRDEEVLHTFPKRHFDFCYSTKEINVPPERYSDFAKVTGSIIIDGLKKEVTARCGDIVANAVTLGFVEDVLNENANPTKDEYAKRINNLTVPDWFDDPMNEM